MRPTKAVLSKSTDDLKHTYLPLRTFLVLGLGTTNIVCVRSAADLPKYDIREDSEHTPYGRSHDGAIHPEITGKKVESMDEIRFSRGKKIPLSKTSYDALPPPKERSPRVTNTYQKYFPEESDNPVTYLRCEWCLTSTEFILESLKKFRTCYRCGRYRG